MKQIKKPDILLIGPLPPPSMGPTIATEIILGSELTDKFKLVHLDTSDHRELSTLGNIDFTNFFLALKHYCKLVRLIITKWPGLVYIPISQTTMGYFRDSGFILLSKLFSRKVICHLRGGNFRNWYYSSGVLLRWIVRCIHSLADGQIVLGSNLRYLFEDIIPQNRIHVIPNGKNIKINYDKKEKSTKIRVLFLSNFILEKGVLDVLRAIPDVFKCYPDVEFVFAGGWFDRHTRVEFENFISENDHLPVEIRGPVQGQTKYELLASSDIFVFPTYYPPEGHPWVIVEAMAASLPIISTDQGAIRESVKDGINGFIIEKNSPPHIVEKIKFLIKNPEERKRMGRESRRLYLENFTENKMIEKLSHAFNTVLSN